MRQLHRANCYPYSVGRTVSLLEPANVRRRPKGEPGRSRWRDPCMYTYSAHDTGIRMLEMTVHAVHRKRQPSARRTVIRHRAGSIGTAKIGCDAPPISPRDGAQHHEEEAGVATRNSTKPFEGHWISIRRTGQQNGSIPLGYRSRKNIDRGQQITARIARETIARTADHGEGNHR